MTDGLLSGRTILLVEDEFFQAREMKALLEGAGATVVGPVARDTEAQALLAECAVDAAVIDMNLGEGSSYTTAEALQREAVPFAFLTGYDQSALPKDYDAVPRLSKPASERALIEEISQLL